MTKMLAFGGLFYILSFPICINAEPFRDSRDGNGTEERERVVYGTETWHSKYPYMVAIHRNPKTIWVARYFVCGGSVLTEDYILTACHCIRDKDNRDRPYDEFYAIAGNDYSSRETSEQHLTHIKKFVHHPRCDLTVTRPTGDLGLMLVTNPFVMGKLIKPVKFISSKMYNLRWWYTKFGLENKLCNVPGWGRTADDNVAVKLQEGTVELMTEQECCKVNRYCNGNALTMKALCADLSQGSAICSGDSGGPLICAGYIFGVVSSAPEKCEPKSYYDKDWFVAVFFTEPFETFDFVQQYVPNYTVNVPTDAQSNVLPFQYPFIVSIADVSNTYIPRSLCAGSILTVSSVLTSCRCLKGLTYEREKNRFRDVAVISGVSDIFEDSLFKQTLDIIGIHLDYSCTEYKSKFIYDSGIAIVDGEFPFATPHVQPLKIMTDNIPKLQKVLTELQESSFECVMVTWGYGYEQPPTVRINILSEWKVRLFTAHECQRKICGEEQGLCYDAFSRIDELCSEAYNHSLPCLADKGGPLICNGYFFGFISDYDQLCSSPNYVQFTSVISAFQVIRTTFPKFSVSNKKSFSTGNHIHLSAAMFLISCLSTFATVS